MLKHVDRQQKIREHLIKSLRVQGITSIDGKTLEHVSYRRLLGVLALKEAANS